MYLPTSWPTDNAQPKPELEIWTSIIVLIAFTLQCYIIFLNLLQNNFIFDTGTEESCFPAFSPLIEFHHKNTVLCVSSRTLSRAEKTFSTCDRKWLSIVFILTQSCEHTVAKPKVLILIFVASQHIDEGLFFVDQKHNAC